MPWESMPERSVSCMTSVAMSTTESVAPKAVMIARICARTDEDVYRGRWAESAEVEAAVVVADPGVDCGDAGEGDCVVMIPITSRGGAAPEHRSGSAPRAERSERNGQRVNRLV
ncbi:hypothetical protein GCM10009755_07950 [Brevibacterium samyangense]|uniref:Uncharacterized protein n=1 Tax=Brevibacterium samyangense TaxID=366888 RepID=A0ABN2T8Q6_9MICO